jgi:hypothetical protein
VPDIGTSRTAIVRAAVGRGRGVVASAGGRATVRRGFARETRDYQKKE